MSGEQPFADLRASRTYHRSIGQPAATAERRVEELKVLADGFARKLTANGFSVREGIDALKPYLRIKALAAAKFRGSACTAGWASHG